MSHQPRRRGRPPRTRVEKLRDQIWIYAVQRASGLSTGYALEKAVESDKFKREKGVIHRPRKWDGYVDGSQGPGQPKGKPGAVDFAEARFPGTAYWHRHVIWEALGKEKLDRFECKTLLEQLPPDMVSRLFDQPAHLYGARVLNPFDEDMAHWITSLGNLDALAAVVLLIKLSEAMSSSDLRNRAQNCYHYLQKSIPLIPELEPFYCNLFEIIDGQCKYWAFLSNTERMDIMIYWEGRADYYRNHPDKKPQPDGPVDLSQLLPHEYPDHLK